MAAWKLVTVVMKAKRTWSRLPPEQRKRLVEGAATTLKTKGPIVAKRAADTARERGPVIAKRVADAIQKARKG